MMCVIKMYSTNFEGSVFSVLKLYICYFILILTDLDVLLLQPEICIIFTVNFINAIDCGFILMYWF